MLTSRCIVACPNPMSGSERGHRLRLLASRKAYSMLLLNDSCLCSPEGPATSLLGN